MHGQPGLDLRVARIFFVVTAALAILLGSAGFASADGAGAYAEECAKCHGASGAADTPVGKAMNVPVLSGVSKADVAKHVRSSPKHKAISDKLSDEELAAVATKVAGF